MIQHGYLAIVFDICLVIEQWLPFKLHDGVSDLRLNDVQDLN